MGRRIPKSRRHKKLKFVDPCYSGPLVRPNNRKSLPNEPPLEDDYQEVPNSVQQLVDIKNRTDRNKFKKKKKKKKMTAKDDFIIVKKDKIEDRQPGMTKPIKALPDQVAQRPNESQKHFLWRLQRMADMAMTEAKVEEKYDVNIINIDKSGNAEYVSGGPKETGARKREKRKKYKQKEKEKKKKRKLGKEESEFVKDTIQFGEVVMAPPVLSFKPKNAPQTNAGNRNLMLTTMLKKNIESTPYSSGETSIRKKKFLSASRKLILEAERNRVVDLYRSMKKRNKVS